MNQSRKSLSAAMVLGTCLIASACADNAAIQPQQAHGETDTSNRPPAEAVAAMNIPLADMRYEDIAVRYSVSMDWMDVGFPLEFPYGKIEGTAATEGEVAAYREIFVTEFGRYPRNLIAASGLERIVLCKDLALNGQLRTAIPEFETHTLFLDCVRGNHAPDYQRQVIHHEYYHMIDHIDDGELYKDAAWAALNAPEFNYGGGGASVQGDSRQSLTTEDNPGFFTNYSMSAIEEDKAEIFAHLMVNPQRLLKQAGNDPTLASKVDLLKKQLEQFCAEMNGEFWNPAMPTQE